MRRVALPVVFVVIGASCVRAAAPASSVSPVAVASPSSSVAPDSPARPAHTDAPLDAGRAAAKPTCVKAPPDALCDWPPECKRFGEQMDGPNGKGFWMGFNTVCSCAKVPEKTVTAELVVRELGKDWSIVVAECPDHYEPTTFLRETTVFAMPFLADRPSRVEPIEAFFKPYVAALSDDKKSANYKFALHQRSVLSGLRGARWVRFANELPDGGGVRHVTDYVVGFLPSGHLAGFYTDGERW